MKAAVWRAHGEPMAVEEVELRPLGTTDVLIRIQAANACVTDAIVLGLMVERGGMEERTNGGLGIGDMPMPQILGHGGVGVVEAVGSEVRVVKPGDRVMALANPFCGRCYFCLRDRPDQCVQIVFVGPASGRLPDGIEVSPNANIGAYAEHAIVPDTQVVPVETSVPDDELALLADGVGGGLGGALIVAPVQVGSSVAVFGCGATGLAYIQGARIAGAGQIIAVDPIASRRQLATELGATDTVDPSAGNVVEMVRELTPDVGGFAGRGVEYAFEASGDPRAVEQAWAVTRAVGHVVLASVTWDLAAKVSLPAVPLAMFGKTIHSCQWGWINIRRDLPRFIHLIEAGHVKVSPLVTRHSSLEGLNEALAESAARGSLGTIMTP
jgi:S-(hydroxymethyl)glutathione dehydrogenase / alcohol dehydrogenase